MIIVGIDPGTTRIGFGVISSKDGDLKYLDSGYINLESADPQKRLFYIFEEISSLIKRVKPDIVGVEKVFFSKNKKTALEVSEARGVIVAAVLNHQVSVRHYTPLQVKQAVSTYGAADKKEVQKMVSIILDLEKPPEPDDVADALAVAICCSQQNWEEKII